MRTRDPECLPWARAERFAVAAFVVALLASLAFLVHPWYDPTNDSAMYVATGRALAAGEGYSFLGIPFRHRPPGFAAMLAPLLALRGTDFRALNLFVSLWGVAGVVFLYLFARARLGWPLALLVAAAVWLNPAYRELCNQVLSDVPGMALFLGCLLLERRAARQPSWKREVLLGIGIGLAALVRSVNLFLVPAIAVARVWERARAAENDEPWRDLLLRRVGVFAAVAALVFAPWALRNRLLDLPDRMDQSLHYSYWTSMTREDTGDPSSRRLSAGELLARIPRQTATLLAVLGSRVQAREGDAARYAIAAGLLGSLVIVLVRRRSAGEVFLLPYFAALALYVSLNSRLVLPFLLLALPAAAEVLARVGGRLLGARRGPLLPAAALGALIVADFDPHRGWPAIERRHARYVDLAVDLTPRLEGRGPLAAIIGFDYTVYLERDVKSLVFAIRRERDPAAAERLIDEYGVRTVILSAINPEERALWPWFQRRYGSFERVGEAFLVSVRP